MGEPLDADPGAEVYRATDPSEVPGEREAAVEFFPPLLFPDARRRYEQFRAQMVGVDLPGVPLALAAGIVEGRPYVLRRRIQGETLAELRSGRGGLRPDLAVRQILPIAEALAYAHTRGLIHGNVTAAHLRVDPGELIFLEGFGSAALRGNGVVGMETPTVLVDLAGLASVLRDLIRGSARTSRAKSPTAALAATFKSRRGGGSPADLEAILRRAGASPEALDRPPRPEEMPGVGYGSVVEFAADLRAWLADRPMRARPPSVWEVLRDWAWQHPVKVLALVALALGLLGLPAGYLWWRERSPSGLEGRNLAHQRVGTDYAAVLQRAHAALESGAWERLEPLLATPFPGLSPGPEHGMLGAWLEVQSRDRLGNVEAPILGLVPAASGTRAMVWTERKLVLLSTEPGVPQMAVPLPGTNSPLTVDFLPDDRVVVVGGRAGVFVTSLPSATGRSESVPPIQISREWTSQLRVSPDGHWIAAVAAQEAALGVAGEVPVWSLSLLPRTVGAPVIPLHLPLAPVVAWNWIEPETGSPRLAVALPGGSAGVWDVTKTNFAAMVNRSGEVWTAAAWDVAGRLMARLNAGGNLEVIHFATAESVFQRDGHATLHPLVAMAPDGSRVAATTPNGDVVVYRVPDGSTIALLPQRQDEVVALSFLPEGSLLTGTRAGTVWKWEPMSKSRQPGTVFTNYLPYVATPPVFSPDNVWLALPEEWEEETETERFVVQQLNQPGDPESIPGQPAGFLNAETLLVWERSAARWEAWGMSPLQRVGTGRLAEGEDWNWVSLSADASRLIVSGPGDRLESYETASGKRVNLLNERVEAAALSADGRTVAVILADSAAVWLPASGALKRRPGLKATATAISRDGRWVAFGDASGQVRLWRVGETVVDEEFSTTTRGITALAFGAGEQTLFVANEAGQLEVWHVPDRQELFRHRLSNPAYWLVMAPDDAGLLCGHPAPSGEESGSSWWWPNESVHPASNPMRRRTAVPLKLPAWFDKTAK